MYKYTISHIKIYIRSKSFFIAIFLLQTITGMDKLRSLLYPEQTPVLLLEL